MNFSTATPTAKQYIKDVAHDVHRFIRAACGQPVRMEEWLASLPAEQVVPVMEPTSASIDQADVHWWDKFGYIKRPTGSTLRAFRLWSPDSHGYTCRLVEHPALQALGTQERLESVTLDIRDIQGLGAGKGIEDGYDSLDAFATQACANLITPVAAATLQKNLDWSEVRITDPGGGDFFVAFTWDGRIFLANSGGSHHFSAARYLALQLGTPVPLTAALYIHGIHLPALKELGREYALFAVPHEPRIYNAFHVAMQTYRFPYGIASITPSIATHKAVFLPKADPRTAHLAALFREAGLMDLSALLFRLANHDHGQSTTLSTLAQNR